MSREDAQIVRRAFEVLVDSLERGVEQHLTEDAEYVEDPVWPEASTYRGRDAIVACFRRYMEALGREDDLTISVENVVDAGERQFVFVRMAGRGTASGAPHEHLWAYGVALRDGRIAHLRAYYDADQALDAAQPRGEANAT